jgi:hypothetical protein
VDGIWCTDDSVLRHEAVNFFKGLFFVKDHCDPSHLSHVSMPVITPEEMEHLSTRVTKAEV